MILTLVVQYNYNGTVSIAEPVASAHFDYVEVAYGSTVEDAKQRAYEYYRGTDYELVFVDEEGDEI